jgi:hypothetical protein
MPMIWPSAAIVLATMMTLAHLQPLLSSFTKAAIKIMEKGT